MLQCVAVPKDGHGWIYSCIHECIHWHTFVYIIIHLCTSTLGTVTIGLTQNTNCIIVKASWGWNAPPSYARPYPISKPDEAGLFCSFVFCVWNPTQQTSRNDRGTHCNPLYSAAVKLWSLFPFCTRAKQVSQQVAPLKDARTLFGFPDGLSGASFLVLSHHVPLDPLIENCPTFLWESIFYENWWWVPQGCGGVIGGYNFLFYSQLIVEFFGLSLSVCQRSEDCFYYCSERNNVVVWFGTLKVQSFILTEVSDCGLLIVVTASTFLKRKDMLKIQKQFVQDLIPPLSIYIHMCTLYTYTNIWMPRFSPSGFFGPSRCLIPTPGLTTEYPIFAVCVCVCVYIHIHSHPR